MFNFDFLEKDLGIFSHEVFLAKAAYFNPCEIFGIAFFTKISSREN